ncbi:MAG: hypothetical protein K8U57_26215 [Planctomycetes bacterium]|nr:hypothetical protein [Planctomycetota bacterium]
MEPVLIDAYRRMLTTHQCSVDRILEEPELRSAFLSLVRSSVPEGAESVILHGLNNLRKKSKLPRRDEAHASNA